MLLVQIESHRPDDDDVEIGQRGRGKLVVFVVVDRIAGAASGGFPIGPIDVIDPYHRDAQHAGDRDDRHRTLAHRKRPEAGSRSLYVVAWHLSLNRLAIPPQASDFKADRPFQRIGVPTGVAGAGLSMPTPAVPRELMPCNFRQSGERCANDASHRVRLQSLVVGDVRIRAAPQAIHDRLQRRRIAVRVEGEDGDIPRVSGRCPTGWSTAARSSWYGQSQHTPVRPPSQ